MTQSITATVGDNGTNKPIDVAIIQGLLAALPEQAGGSAIKQDGIFGTNTLAAIKKFQHVQLQMEDGLVQPSDYTIKRLCTLVETLATTITPIDVKYAALKATQFDLGAKVGDLVNYSVGTAQGFDGGHIYHHPSYGAFEIHGLILSKYVEVGGAQGALGFPISDERDWVAGGGRVSYFQYGSLFYTDATGVTLQAAPGK